MTQQELNGWWASLTIREKERIAAKVIFKHLSPETGITANLDPTYPHCTDVWNMLPHETKYFIYRHLTDDHGVLLEEWQEGEMMSE